MNVSEIKSDNAQKNKRIVKNTFLLYFRMLLLMAISLFTSRVILQSLGIEDYGLYEVVGGFVAMFGILSSSLTAAISRFITVELGKQNLERLKVVFHTSVKVQLILASIITILGEVVGYWFINYKMQIPCGRDTATYIVLHCSLLSFIVTLVSVPYNSAIVAHEKMAAFAYISIVEVSLRLLVAYAIMYSSYDRLILYAVLMLIIQLSIRILYGFYCSKHFNECKGSAPFDKNVFHQILGFAGWSFLGNGSYILSTQGVNMLINVFFGVVVNAARGISNQINFAVTSFVNNFTMALNPQIIKSYSSGDKNYAFNLACKGAKYSYLMMLTLSLPIIMEIDAILKIWLHTPPANTQVYVKWVMLAALSTVTGNSLVTLNNATGKIRQYQLVISIFMICPFVLTWLAFKIGYNPESAFIINFVINYLLIYVRLFLVHKNAGIPYGLYLREVIVKTHIITVLALIVPLIIVAIMPYSIYRLTLTFVGSLLTTILLIYFIALSCDEKQIIEKWIRRI